MPIPVRTNLKRNRRCQLWGGFLAFLLTAMVALAGAPQELSRRSELYQKVAAQGNAATVGIYCIKKSYLHFYGTGILISSDGYLLTSTTVVPKGATKIKIHLTNQRVLDATVVEINEKLESALLKADGVDLPHIPIADGPPSLGETCYTFGNARNMIRMGKHASFSVGTLSGIYKVKSIDSQSSYSGLAFETDAAINPGQDGGPLLNSKGQLIGVISLSYSPTRWQGVAIPVQSLQKGLKTFGKIKFKTKPLVTPPVADGNTARGLSGYARGISRALIWLDVERTYKPETMPRTRAEDYIKTVPGFERLPELRQRQVIGKFYQADALLATNQHIRRPPGSVTGMIISPDGHILTSSFNLAADRIWVHRQDGLKQLHFYADIDRMTAFNEKDYRQASNRVRKITAVLASGRRIPAKVLARHLPLGITLLKVDAKDLPFIDFKRLAASPETGGSCGVVGIAEGDIPYTLNTGIISAAKRNRSMQFQFDALANYGNSGGPILSADGKILGIAVQPMDPGPTMGRIFSPSEILRWHVAPNSGVSFAARSDRIVTALPKLKAGISTDKMGGAFVGFAPETKSLLAEEVVLSYVVPGSPADKGGLRKGDIITRFNGRKVTAWKHILGEMDRMRVGQVVSVQVKRKGRSRYLSIKGRRVENADDLLKLFESLRDGDQFKGRFTDTTNEVVKLKITLGERK